MSFDEISPLSAKQPKLSPICGIDKLADADLAEIFKRLPPIDRLLISEVCKRWNGISRKAWLDITQLYLSPIPGPNIDAIIKQCPNLRHVLAVRKTFNPGELHVVARANLTSVKLYGCTVFIEATAVNVSDAFSAVFSGNLQATVWEELLLHDFIVKLHIPSGCREVDELPRRQPYPPSQMLDMLRAQVTARGGNFDQLVGVGKVQITFLASFPASLKRLQVSGALSAESDGYYSEWQYFSQGIEQRGQFECLLFHNKPNSVVSWSAFRSQGALDALRSVQNLRELQLSAVYFHGDFGNLCISLTNLETLFLHSVGFVDADSFARLVTKHPTLKILALTGMISISPPAAPEMDFPARVRYGNGFNADPLPVLRIFVGKSASEKIRFPKFPSDAAEVFPISEPLPQFLERDDIKPIFEGIWIAEKIKEAAKHGDKLFEYEEHIASSVRPIDT